MASAAPANNDPSGDPPAADAGNSDADIFDVLGLRDDSSGAAAAIAAKAEPVAPAASGEPGAGSGAAPSPAPVTPPAEPPAPATPAAPEPAPAPASATPVAPSPAPVTPPAALPADEEALRRASLEATNEALRRELDALRANPQAATPAAPGSGEQGVPKEPFRYNLTLPQPIQDGLLSDNPVPAINQLINEFGTVLHHHVLSILEPRLKALEERPVGQAATPADDAKAAARTAYYAKFPGHDNALVAPILNNEARKMAAEFPNLPWDDNYVGALGARVNAAIEALKGGSGGAAPVDPTPTPTPTPTPAVTPPAKPAAMLPSGQRGADAVVPAGDISVEIADVLDPFSAG